MNRINVILAKALVGKYFKPEGENGDFEGLYNEDAKTTCPGRLLTEFKGKELEELRI